MIFYRVKSYINYDNVSVAFTSVYPSVLYICLLLENIRIFDRFDCVFIQKLRLMLSNKSVSVY